MRRNRTSISKSALAGAAGGLAASYVMNQFQSLMSYVEKRSNGGREQQQEQQPSGDDATVKTAKAISHKVLRHELTTPEKKWTGPVVHYAFGTLMGALYGVLAEKMPVAKAGIGTAYGTAVWLGADEIGVPAFGLSEGPTKTPVSGHLKALASHVVYGMTTDLTRKALLREH